LTKDRETNFDLLGVDPGGRVLETSGGVMRMAQNRPLFAAVLAGSLALHVLALLILNLLERLPTFPSAAAIEIPVELVSDPGASKQKGSQTGSPQSAKAASSAGQPKSPAAKPATEQAKVAPPAPQPPAKKQAQAKPPSVVTPPKQAQPEPPKQAVAQTEPPKPAPAPQPTAAPAQPPPNLRLAVVQPQAPATAQTSPPSAMPSMAALQMQATRPTAAASPSAMMDDPLLAVAVPKPSDEGDETMSYKTVVFGMLELAKQFPADARARGAHGTSLVYFELDDKGGVKTVKLLKSSGDTELDVESLAVVERAAPFPKPPLGAQKSFAADIEYDPNEP
jgi:protein TonB